MCGISDIVYKKNIKINPDEIKNSKIVNIFCDTDKIEKKYYKINDNFKWKLYNIAKWEKLFKVKV